MHRPRTKRSGSSNAVADGSSSSSSEDENGGRLKGVFAGLSAVFRGAGGKRPPLDRMRSNSELSVASSRRSSRSSIRSSTAARLRGRTGSRTEDEASSSSEGSQDAADPYGPYGSSVSTSSTLTRSTPPGSDDSEDNRDHRRRGLFVTPFGSHGAVGGPDPLFGDSRIDMPDMREESPTGQHHSDDVVVSASSATASGGDFGSLALSATTEFRQPIYIADEDMQIVFVGWGGKTWKRIAWSCGCILSLGILWLLGRWLPDWWLQGRGKVRKFTRADSVVVHVRVKAFNFQFEVPAHVDCNRINMVTSM